ncbi:hypothetical protein Q4603_19265 [Zobellia galactanivorans]|uniref:Conserved hypothetical membrane protein n=1 Tax=Zobellia galactanivorans (strain DSM 12802 / CCUG 47099 / CIP 106680 / NCIMB 13871 / Dsij) TaxID=63186 RepID=G0LCC1_ZOBGA|nr:hypothetical protein [Zobellia galactanivorans]MBU3027566.1 hypothetical protein [Zobellia galactanivorans]MDO6810771.1 hypothetical protein [Zobellia galactanivorans]CAZ96818.1 Conserved hypothetical membrane protein [Zobellia galactanivorans]
MYQALTFGHSVVRWLVLLSLLYSIYRAYRGYFQNLDFSKHDNRVRHWTATLAHIQLLVGILLYTQSPIVSYFWGNTNEALKHIDTTFFGIIHMALMLLAIVFLTIGSALAKRKPSDREKFKTQLLWFSVALTIIFIAIPWPFSPFANRPYFR